MRRLYTLKPLSGQSVARPLIFNGQASTLKVRSQYARRSLYHTTTTRQLLKPYLLADIGEGITECQVLQWFVKPGDKVEQFDRICEVQSDKATVEITSRYDGRIASLYYKVDDIAVVGKPLVDIDIEDSSVPKQELSNGSSESPAIHSQDLAKDSQARSQDAKPSSMNTIDPRATTPDSTTRKGLSPAVRHLIKASGLDLMQIQGTGKDGRILKEDVRRHINQPDFTPVPEPGPPKAVGGDRRVLLTAVERQMFKTMTESLTIPQFLYTHTVDFSSLQELREQANAARPGQVKLTLLPFIVKIVSQVLANFTQFNAHLDTSTDASKPQLIHKVVHNFGIAVDSPQGLVVPVIKDIRNHSVASLAQEINRLATLAQAGKLTPGDFSGATFIVSNIGSLGGDVVHPVIVSPMVAIVGIGKARKTAAVMDDQIVVREQVILSWSADHRVLDGAVVAKCARAVGESIENIDNLKMLLN